MGEAENPDLMQISEGLKFVTACLIGHRITVQTRTIFVSGTTRAVSLDNDYGILLQLGGRSQIIKVLLSDIVCITAEDVSLELDRDAIYKYQSEGNLCMVVTDNVQSSSRQSGEDIKATEQCATSFSSSMHREPDQKSGENTEETEQLATSPSGNTNTVPDEKLHHPSVQNTSTMVLNATSVASSTIAGIDQTLMMPIMQPAQTGLPLPYQPPINYGVWRSDVGQFRADALPPYPAYVAPYYPQVVQPIQGNAPYQVPGYGNQPHHLPFPACVAPHPVYGHSYYPQPVQPSQGNAPQQVPGHLPQNFDSL